MKAPRESLRHDAGPARPFALLGRGTSLVVAPPLLLVLAFILATRLEAWALNLAEQGHRDGSVLEVVMGDSRRLFANQFVAKADVYFHGGYYPSIFENQPACNAMSEATDSGAAGEHHHEAEGASVPLDWIDRFGRHFYASVETHLSEGGPQALAAGKTSPTGGGGLEREMLPWLRLSTAMDPQNIQSYIIAAYWLHERLQATAEAENFLREGLRANPDSHELLFELGRLALDAHQDSGRAQALWRSGIARWHAVEAAKPEPDYFGLRQLLAYLALSQERSGQYREALAHLQEADALPGGQGLYAVRIKRLQELLAGNTPAAGPPG